MVIVEQSASSSSRADSRNSLTLSRHQSLLSITLGRPSMLNLVSVRSWYKSMMIGQQLLYTEKKDNNAEI